MRYIGIMVTPGKGYYQHEVSDDMTVAALIKSQNLTGRTIVLDGETVDPSNYDGTTLSGVEEVWATGGAKGA